MEIKVTNTASLNNQIVLKLQDLLIKFEQSAFKGIISNKIDSGAFAVNSKLGSFQITSNLDLKIGDELTLKIKPSQSSIPASLEVSKIERSALTKYVTDSVKLNAIKSNTVKLDSVEFKVVINQKEALNQIPKLQNHFIAKVIAQDKSSLHLQDLKGNLFSLEKSNFSQFSPQLNNGERVVIKWLQSNKVEIQTISKEALLIQAQRQLLPKFPQSLPTHQRLAIAAFKLFQSIDNEPVLTKKPVVAESLAQKNQQPLSSTLKKNSENTSKLDIQKVIIKDASSSIDKKVSPPSTESPKSPKLEQESPLSKTTPVILQKIKNDLQRLLRSHPITVKTLSPDNIQKLLISLNVIDKPQAKGSSPISFIQKLNTIIQSIEKVLNEVDISTAKNKQVKEAPELLSELLKFALKDTKQAFESIIHKLMLQNTTSKLNQETNLTQLINTQIPFESDKHTKDVHLKIKQRTTENSSEDDCWEIQLSLEMGSLGLISAKIILRNSNEVSVTFLAEQPDTKQLIDDKKNIFFQQMKNAGFTIDSINVFLGKNDNNALPFEITNKKFIDINV